MSEPPEEEKKSDSFGIDLSELQGLNFGPAWTDGKSAEARRGDRPSKEGPKKERRDRRPPRPERSPEAGSESSSDRRGEHRSGGGRREGARDARSRGGPRDRDQRGRGGPRRGRDERPAHFEPVVDVSLYPEDTPFKALAHALKTSCRTYELFEIARLILGKPDRFVVVIQPLKKGDGPSQFFTAVPDGLPFETEEAAVSHVIRNYLDRFFDVEEAEVEPPKGSFPFVHRCGVTNKLIGPPNYHRYQSLLQEHYRNHITNMPFERFQQKLTAERDEAAVQEWMESMRKETRYIPKTEPEERLESVERAKFYLLSKRRSEVVRAVTQARFPGKLLDLMPRGPIRSSIETYREQQMRFPLETANNLRGRLRRMRFTIYKRGSKGVTFVCAIKRKFPTEKTIFSESIQQLIDFIQAHPKITARELPTEFLGLDPKSDPPKAEERAPDIEKVPEDQAQAIVEKHEKDRHEEAAAEPGSVPDAEPEKPITEPVAESDGLSADERQQWHQMMMDLRWLILEGYVTHFGDDRLTAQPTVRSDSPEAQEQEGHSAPRKGKSPANSELERSVAEIDQSAPADGVTPADSAPAPSEAPAAEPVSPADASSDPTEESAPKADPPTPPSEEQTASHLQSAKETTPLTPSVDETAKAEAQPIAETPPASEEPPASEANGSEGHASDANTAEQTRETSEDYQSAETEKQT